MKGKKGKKVLYEGYVNTLWDNTFRYVSVCEGIFFLRFPSVYMKRGELKDGRSHKKVKVRITIEEV